MFKKIAYSVLLLMYFSAPLIAQIKDATFTLKSNDLGGQITEKQVFNNFGCKGENKSPQLYWVSPPEQTKSFALTMYDPDAPTGSGWWHWIVFDIPKHVTELPDGAGNIENKQMPENVIQSITDFGSYGYGGPCPPEGDAYHAYIITVYALDVEKLGLDKNTNPATVGFYLNNHTIAKASLIAYYKR